MHRCILRAPTTVRRWPPRYTWAEDHERKSQGPLTMRASLLDLARAGRKSPGASGLRGPRQHPAATPGCAGPPAARGGLRCLPAAPPLHVHAGGQNGRRGEDLIPCTTAGCLAGASAGRAQRRRASRSGRDRQRIANLEEVVGSRFGGAGPQATVLTRLPPSRNGSARCLMREPSSVMIGSAEYCAR
jgi:hypothetical protein